MSHPNLSATDNDNQSRWRMIRLIPQDEDFAISGWEKTNEYIAANLDSKNLIYQAPDEQWTIRLESANSNPHRNEDCLLIVRLNGKENGGLMSGSRIKEHSFLVLCGPKIVDDFHQNAVIRADLKSLKKKWGRLEPEAVIRVNGIFHKICVRGDEIFLGHEIWNASNQQWEPNKISFGRWEDNFQFEENVVSLVYVKSQNIILLFGGTMSGDYQYIYLGIWRYDIAKAQWSWVEEIAFNFTFCDVALTSNEEYVVIVGGRPLTRDESNEEIQMEKDRIFILDIRNQNKYELWGTSIEAGQCTKRNYVGLDVNRRWFKQNRWGYNCQITRGSTQYDNLLISGWIRRLFASEGFVGVTLPAGIVHQLIGEFKGLDDMVHWIFMTTTVHEDRRSIKSVHAKHHVMPLREILSARNDDVNQIRIRMAHQKQQEELEWELASKLNGKSVEGTSDEIIDGVHIGTAVQTHSDSPTTQSHRILENSYLYQMTILILFAFCIQYYLRYNATD